MAGPDRHRPCMNCPDRHSACWDGCADYKAYQEEQKKKHVFLIQKNQGHIFPPTVRYSKSSGRYVAPKTRFNHKKEG